MSSDEDQPTCGGDVIAFESEYLGMTGGTMSDQPKVIITIRPAPTVTFASANFAISKEQAKRLRADLDYVFDHYDTLKEIEHPVEVEAAPVEPAAPPKKARKRKSK